MVVSYCLIVIEVEQSDSQYVAMVAFTWFMIILKVTMTYQNDRI